MRQLIVFVADNVLKATRDYGHHQQSTTFCLVRQAIAEALLWLFGIFI